MIKSKNEMFENLEELDAKLTQQLEDVQGRRGVHEDVVRLMVPPLRDIVVQIRDVVEALPE